MRKFLFLSLALCFLFNRSTAAPAAKDEARAIIEKAIKAQGGEEKLGKIKAATFKAKGTVDIMGNNADFSVEATILMSGKQKQEYTLDFMGQNIAVTVVNDGEKGWMLIMGQIMDLPEQQLKELRESSHVRRVETLVPLLKDKDLKLSILGESKVNDRLVVGVKVERKDYRDINLYFDKQNGLLVKTGYRALGQNMNEVNQETFYSGHKEFEGIKWPTKAIIHHDDNKYMEAEFTEVKFPDKIDDSVFAKP